MGTPTLSPLLWVKLSVQANTIPAQDKSLYTVQRTVAVNNNTMEENDIQRPDRQRT